MVNTFLLKLIVEINVSNLHFVIYFKYLYIHKGAVINYIGGAKEFGKSVAQKCAPPPYPRAGE